MEEAARLGKWDKCLEEAKKAGSEAVRQYAVLHSAALLRDHHALPACRIIAQVNILFLTCFFVQCILSLPQHGLTAAREAVGLALKCMREALTAEPSAELMQVEARARGSALFVFSLMDRTWQAVRSSATRCHRL
jgi:hypothetical protein